MKKTNKTFTMQESYDVICEHYEILKERIREYVKEYADENGVLMLGDGDESYPYVITTQEHNRRPDQYTECRCLALRVVDEDVQFCALSSWLFDEDRQYGSLDLSHELLAQLWWYVLDWDMANPFQYNIERIAYYLTSINQ